MIGKVFLGKFWHWLLVIVVSALFWFCGTQRLHVIEFNVFVMAMIAGTTFVVGSIVLFHVPGEQITRDELVPADDDETNSSDDIDDSDEKKSSDASTGSTITSLQGEVSQLKKDKESQVLEDVICLVFLQYYFEAFSLKHNDEKLIEILKKTWKKMSEKGRTEALKLDYSEKSLVLIKATLA